MDIRGVIRKKMQKSKIAVVVSLIVVLGTIATSSAGALNWNDFFDTQIFDGSVFNESDVPEEQKSQEQEKLMNFPPGWFNVSWFSEIPIGEYSDKPPGWFDVI